MTSFKFQNNKVKKASAADRSCTLGTVDFSTSPPTTNITWSPDWLVEGDGWAEAVPFELLQKGSQRQSDGTRHPVQRVSISSFDLETQARCQECGWAESIRLPWEACEKEPLTYVKTVKVKTVTGAVKTSKGEKLSIDNFLHLLSQMNEERPYYQNGLGIILFGQSDRPYIYRLNYYQFRRLPLDSQVAILSSLLKAAKLNKGNIYLST